MLLHTEQIPMSDEALNTALEKSEENAIEDNKTVVKVVEKVPIPLGFSYVEGTTRNEGLIIVDRLGNEFVWVPVDNTSTFTTLTKGWSNGSEQTSIGTEPTVLTNSSNDGNEKNELLIWESEKYEAGLEEQFQEEYNAMVKSVKTYGGFYVGRYETSLTGSKVASVKTTNTEQIFKASTNLGINWTTSRSDNYGIWYGLYKYQKELYDEESDSVSSGMIYGCQWDAIMKWMSDVENPNATIADKKFIKDSTGMGNYSESAIATGSNENYKVKNIYDLAGNYAEWTQEASTGGGRVHRGGRSERSGVEFPASFRGDVYPTTAADFYASRLQLYIK